MLNFRQSKTDSLLELLNDVRRHRPPIYDGDLFPAWLEAVGQVLAAVPHPERRWAFTVLVAQDLLDAVPGLTLAMAYGAINEAVQRAAGVKT